MRTQQPAPIIPESRFQRLACAFALNLLAENDILPNIVIIITFDYAKLNTICNLNNNYDFLSAKLVSRLLDKGFYV